MRQVLTLLAKESMEKLHAAAVRSSTIRLAINRTDTLVMEELPLIHSHVATAVSGRNAML